MNHFTVLNYSILLVLGLLSSDVIMNIVNHVLVISKIADIVDWSLSNKFRLLHCLIGVT
jgi:hypothetical protein